MALSKGAQKLATQLNVPLPKDLSKFYSEDADKAINAVKRALELMLSEIRALSPTGVFEGYYVKVEKVGNKTKIRLPKSGVDISGQFEWLVYIQKPGGRWNVFDILNDGRKQLPYREKPYPLWGAALRQVKSPPPARFPSNSRIPGAGGFSGSNPMGLSRAAAYGGPERPRKGRGDPMVFSRGPLARIPKKFLYLRVLSRIEELPAFANWQISVIERAERG